MGIAGTEVAKAAADIVIMVNLVVQELGGYMHTQGCIDFVQNPDAATAAGATGCTRACWVHQGLLGVPGAIGYTGGYGIHTAMRTAEAIGSTRGCWMHQGPLSALQGHLSTRGY